MTVHYYHYSLDGLLFTIWGIDLVVLFTAVTIVIVYLLIKLLKGEIK